MNIYKEYNQAALNSQYNNRLHVPDYAAYLEKWDLLSRQTEVKYPVVKDISYGNLSRELLDIYPSGKSNSKTLIFIHGGYWRSMDKSNFQFVADAFHSYNITTVIITYPLAPDFLIDQAVASCRKAVEWVHHHIEEYNGSNKEINIAGHSAGGHLAALILTESIGFDYANKGCIKGIFALSGLYNLLPIQLSDINDTLQMNKTMALQNSPVQLKPLIKCPLLLAVGSNETEEFKEQSKELYTCWNKEIPVKLIQPAGLNHYSIVGAFADKKSSLHESVLGFMGV